MGDGEEVIREVWRRWNEGEREFDAEVIDPEIHIHSALTGQEFQGEAGLIKWIGEIEEQFDQWSLSIDEINRSGDRFVVRGSVRARGRHSGVDLDQAITWNVELRDGRLLRLNNVIGTETGAGREEP
ncbi:MAG TPA: nuclear transport factor 2 family protein [Solirubrobacterales bacterium]|jgi:ketosteroid isomerase-like protein